MTGKPKSKLIKIGRKTFSRRTVLKGMGAGALAAAAAPTRAIAQDANTVRVGYIAPATGALAAFGEPNPYLLSEARRLLAGGLKVGGKTYNIEFIDRDGQSDPVRAGQIANNLINSDNIDFMLTTSTPETINPVSDACEAAGVPCLSTGMPWEPWYFGRGAKPGEPTPFKWTYHFGFGMANFSLAYISHWNGPVETNRKVAFLNPNDADGNALRNLLIPLLEDADFNVIDPGPYENGTPDYSAQIATFKAENCEIFTTGPIPPDFAVFWRQAAQQGYTRQVKIAQVSKTCLFPSQVEALGSLGPKIATVAFWHPTFPYPSPFYNKTSQELADDFETQTGRQWNQMLGDNAALFDAGVETLRASGDPKDKDAIRAAMSTLKVTTPVGHVDFTQGPVPNCYPMIFVGAQWDEAEPGSKFKLRLIVTDNADDPNVPVQATLRPYNA